ncbi:MAG: hypothetical protein KGL95_10590, partial [Patescibacteria group bacterium]|nr:hypothetical protein [Patescibacteria group bacterium]
KAIKQQALEKRIEERKIEENNTKIQNKEQPKEVKKEDAVKENLEEKIIEILKKSMVAMWRYAVGRGIGFSPDKAGLEVRTPLNNLVKSGKVKIWECRIRKQETEFYYLAGDTREVCHAFMMETTKDKIGDWKIIFEATHGTGKSDLILEKNGNKIAIECETFLKKDTSDLQDRIAKNRLEGMETIIVVPTETAMQFYSELFNCKVIGLWEIGGVLKNWQ